MKKYAEQYGKEEELVDKLKQNYPLLTNPTYATETFNSSNLALYSSVVLASSSTTSSTSATGGGGAGAF